MQTLLSQWIASNDDPIDAALTRAIHSVRSQLNHVTPTLDRAAMMAWLHQRDLDLGLLDAEMDESVILSRAMSKNMSIDDKNDITTSDEIWQLVPKTGETTPSSGSRFSKDWLKQNCDSWKVSHADTVWSSHELYERIVACLSMPSYQAESELVDLLGFDSLGWIGELLSNRDALQQSINSSLNEVVTPPKLSKKELKAMKRHASEISLEPSFDLHRMRRFREQQLDEAAAEPLFTEGGVVLQEQEKLPHVYGMPQTRGVLSSFGTRFTLPVGTQRENTVEYEMFTVPCTSSDAAAHYPQRLISHSFSKFSQRAFQGYETLNRMQSLVYGAAYKSNENLLVSAPTGAGKTDVAMMCVVRALEQHLSQQGYLDPDSAPFKDSAKLLSSIKIVYVTPMKALAAEITFKFSSRLKPFGVKVRELTGDMNLTRKEFQETQMLVVTPEKWDVITRKPRDDHAATDTRIALLIMDEIHLLHDERGAVLETLVARTLREVELSQQMIRIVGLSATLPNYADVAQFLRVDKRTGLFAFGAPFRPVPLTQQFVGIKAKQRHALEKNMISFTLEQIYSFVRQGHQVMVFVHARNETLRTANALLERIKEDGELSLFSHDGVKPFLPRCRHKSLRYLLESGFSIHHAGMVRSDRDLVQELFSQGLVKVLCCTATLAWGVNLPAHAVIIKGTQLYDPQRGGQIDLSILDLLQIFGRAGRPQYETHGQGILLTTHDKLQHYLQSVLDQMPIESRFLSGLEDHLNAEIVLGNVSSIQQGLRWLLNTFLYVRMRRHPSGYGLPVQATKEALQERCEKLLIAASCALNDAGMIVYDKSNQQVTATSLGHIASRFYLKQSTVELLYKNGLLKPRMTESALFGALAQCSEFSQLKLRESEMMELEQLAVHYCRYPVDQGLATIEAKVSILMQVYIARQQPMDPCLVSDMLYCAQNGPRLMRAIYSICLWMRWPVAARRALTVCLCLERRVWMDVSPALLQMPLADHQLKKLETKESISIQRLREMNVKELEQVSVNFQWAQTLFMHVQYFPMVRLQVSLQMKTLRIFQVTVTVSPDFVWYAAWHGHAEPWTLMIEDADILYHFEHLQIRDGVSSQVQCYLPLTKQQMSFTVRCVSDRWLQAEVIETCKVEAPTHMGNALVSPVHPLTCLSMQVLNDSELEEKYSFETMNLLQSHCLHTLYYQGVKRCLLAAPSGSGKHTLMEWLLWKAIKSGMSVLYVSTQKDHLLQMKQSWEKRSFPWKVSVLERDNVDFDSQIILTTPKQFMQQSVQVISTFPFQFLIVDELVDDNAVQSPWLEVMLSFLAQSSKSLSLLILSQPVANATQIANWLQLNQVFSYPVTMRSFPVEVSLHGFVSQLTAAQRSHYMNQWMDQCLSRNVMAKERILIVVADVNQVHRTLASLRYQQLLHDQNRTLLIGCHSRMKPSDWESVLQRLSVSSEWVLICDAASAYKWTLEADHVIIKEWDETKPWSHLLRIMNFAGNHPSNQSVARVSLLVQEEKKAWIKQRLYEPWPLASSFTSPTLHPSLLHYFLLFFSLNQLQSYQQCMDAWSWLFVVKCDNAMLSQSVNEILNYFTRTGYVSDWKITKLGQLFLDYGVDVTSLDWIDTVHCTGEAHILRALGLLTASDSLKDTVLSQTQLTLLDKQVYLDFLPEILFGSRLFLMDASVLQWAYWIARKDSIPGRFLYFLSDVALQKKRADWLMHVMRILCRGSEKIQFKVLSKQDHLLQLHVECKDKTLAHVYLIKDEEALVLDANVPPDGKVTLNIGNLTNCRVLITHLHSNQQPWLEL